MSPPLFNKYLVRKFQEPGNEASEQNTDLATKRGSRVAGMEDPFWIRQGSDTEESCDRLSVRWREEGRIHAEGTGSNGPDIKGLSLQPESAEVENVTHGPSNLGIKVYGWCSCAAPVRSEGSRQENPEEQATGVTLIQWIKKNHRLDFPGAPVVKNLLVSTGDTVSIPGPGRFYKLQSS